ncbi:MAG: endonuclease MutS2 [Bacillales bacterium]|nr:endonuclease MutS2 [Bacillales bacterium]
MLPNKEILQYELILKEIAGFTYSESAKNLIYNSPIYHDDFFLQNELDLLDEAIVLVYKYGSFPLSSLFDNLDNLLLLKKGLVLSEVDIYRLLQNLIKVNDIKKYLLKYEIKDSLKILEKVDLLVFYPYIEERINKVLNNKLEIVDEATPTLHKIRKSLKNLQASIRTRLESYVSAHSAELVEPIITIRNDRLVIMVKDELKHSVRGIIHGYSASGHTVFFEPDFAVAINAQIEVLKQEEKEEILKILRELGNLFLENYEQIYQNEETLYYFDFLFAKAKYAKSVNAKVGIISKKKEITLKNARHPLISKDKVVANDVLISGDFYVLLISGPNTGGKTVYLKLVGLISLLFQSAFPITVDGQAELSLFDEVYLDIGDEQSISSDLSTFSSHISRIKNILENVTENSLVLIDELGGGTDPIQGEALAMAIIENLVQRKVFSLITTHYSKVKRFALEQKNILNASMIFDEINLKPTFKISYNTIGNSYAYLICKRLGFPEEILERANYHINYYMDNEDKILKELEEQLSLLKVKENEYDKLLLEIDKIENNLKEKEKSFKEEKEKFELNKQEKIQESIKNARLEIDEIINNLKEKESIKMHEINNINLELDKVETNYEVKQEEQHFNIGEEVFVVPLRQNGKIVSIKKDKYLINLDNKILSISGNSLKPSNPAGVITPKVQYQKKEVHNEVKLEINLIGLTVSEALEELKTYLSQALTAHLTVVRVIHGIGTGKLRKGIHDFLNSKGLKFTLAGQFDGGAGASIVYL